MSADELLAARLAFENNDLRTARHHLTNVDMQGVHAVEANQLRQLIESKEMALQFAGSKRIGLAVSLAVLGYLVLLIQSPAGWGQVAWSLLAMVGLPSFIGLLIGKSVNEHSTTSPGSTRFWRAFSIVSVTVLLYALAGMAISRSHMQSADKSGDMLIFATVALVYAGVAGGVSGFVSTLMRPFRKAA